MVNISLSPRLGELVGRSYGYFMIINQPLRYCIVEWNVLAYGRDYFNIFLYALSETCEQI